MHTAPANEGSQAALEPAPGAWLVSYRHGARDVEVGPLPLDGVPVSPPLVAREADCTVIFDGLLYELDSYGDAATAVLRLYRHAGADALQRLRGIFFAVIRDKQADRLLCARDPLGIYPFFYVDAGESFIASPFVDALLADPRVSVEINRAALADRLLHQWSSEPHETYFSAVRRLLPGHALVLEHGSIHAYRYWHPTPPGEEVDWVEEEELERFPYLLGQAVDRCLSFGRAGIYLSGGLDSVAVAAVAAERSRTRLLPPPCALSIVDLDNRREEQDIQVGVAEQLGLPQVLITAEEVPGDQGLLAAALDLCAAWPLPVMNYWMPVHLRLGRAAVEHGCTVTLTGDGGDEWLSAAPIYAADLLRKREFVPLFKLWRDLAHSLGGSSVSSLRTVLWEFGLRPVIRGAVHSLAPRTLDAYRQRRVLETIPGWIAPDPVFRREVEERSIRSRGTPVTRDFTVNARTQLLDRTFTSIDKEETFQRGRTLGLRVLKPFWDVDLVEFLFRAPPDLLDRGGHSKRLARELLNRRFPNLGFDRQRKYDYSSFVDRLLRDEGRAAWQAMGGASALTELGVVDAHGVDEAVATSLAVGSTLDTAYRIWDILSLEAWLRSRPQKGEANE
jgi:asparagine synthase (glutamine-hydrolysing)